VEIKSATGCAARAKLTLPLKASPIVNLPTDAEYCPGSFVKLDPGNQPTGTTFVWAYNGTALSSHQTVNADRTGVYTLTVTNAVGCSTTKSVNVKQVERPVISDIKIENTTVHIIVAGNGMFEYSIDGVSWQASNTFHNVPAGNHTAFVRSGTQPCATAQKAFTIFIISNVFTPNADGINDNWVVEGIENYPGSHVRVIDRFGTVVLDQKVNGTFSWNGRHLSRHLPTGNYWYYIVVSDGRILSGYVMIKIRN
jgi:gliding motility-associated-like protein